MTVFLVGAGPGDPGLITVRGLDLVRRADVLVLDRLAGDQLPLEAKPGCVLINAGKAPGDVAMTQDQINACLVEHGQTGQLIVRLKGGDPFVFGRGSEEAEALHEAGIDYEVVPGISSSLAAPAAAGFPITHRGLSTHVTIVTGHENPDKPETQTDWAALAKAGGTLVVLMGVGRLGLIADALIAGGRPAETPVGIVERGTLPTQRVTTGTLATIAAVAEAAEVRAPAVTVIGEIVAVREAIGWAERLPLAGRVVAVTRARAQADGLTRRLTDLGAKVISAPTISTVPLAGDPIDASVYDVVVVTSPNTPPLLLDRIGGDARVLHGVEVAAIGPGTAEALRQIGVVADTISERAVAEALLETLQDRVAGKRVLIARAEEARDLLPEGLTNAGATVDIVALYRTEYAVPTGEGPLAADAVTFTSASTVRALVAAYPDRDLTTIKGISIGPVTSAAMRELGVGIALEADEHDLDGLISAVLEVLG